MAHLNSHKEICNLFNAIEKKFPVDQWRVNNLDVWPYIRIKLYYHLLNIGNVKIEERKNTIQNQKRTSRITTVKVLVKSFLATRKFYMSLKPKDVLFVGAHFHRVFQNGVYLNRFFDPLIQKYNLEEKVYVFEFQKYYSNSFNKKAVLHLAQELKNYKSFKRIEKILKNKADTVNLRCYKEFQEFLNKNLEYTSSFEMTEDDLIKWSRKVISVTPFFERIIKKVKPNKIVFLSYYGFDDNYAFINAARKMKLRVIDFQHGPQTNVHMAYSEWNKMPKGGFNVMPTEYWNWDYNSKKNIDVWANNSLIKTKVVGHPFIEYCLKQKNDINDKNVKKQILFSLQTAPLDLLIPEVVSLILNSEYHWVLRLHPRNETPISEINRFLIHNKIDANTEIQTAEDVPLPHVLINSILHVTNYSGCVLEALALNITTVIIHNVGVEMFKHYIDDKKVFYVNRTSKDFAFRISEILNSDTKSYDDFNIINDFNPIN